MTIEGDARATGNPAGYVRGLIAEGTNATQGLAQYREAGGAIQDSRWYALYSSVYDSVARSPAMLAIDPYGVPGPADYGTWAMGKGGQFATQVEVTIFDRGLGQVVTMQHTYVTDGPHAGVEAEADAWDVFDPANSGADYDQVMLGALATSYYQTTPYGG